MYSKEIYNSMANAIRILSIDAVEEAGSGHPGMPMGMADVATILFSEFLNFNPKHPNWYDRDRFILSNGHGSMLLYSLLYLTGYKDINIDDLKNFRQLHSKTAGHPEWGHLNGIETSTGPLGQGLANAVGMALAEKIMASNFPSVTDHYTYVMVGDGCLMEGISQEAISLAGHLQLNKLIILFDDNKITIDGPLNLSSSEDQIARFKACNWHSIEIDGHDFDQIRNALVEAKSSPLPSIIACKTNIGHGSPNKAGTSAVHGSPFGLDEISAIRKNLNWNHEPWNMPEEILNYWRNISDESYNSWLKKYEALSSDVRLEFDRRNSGNLPANFDNIISSYKQELFSSKSSISTRVASGNVISLITKYLPELIGGSADLTPSNNTKTNESVIINKDNGKGSYIHYGIREHAMAAIMNGMALHKGIIPYGGTFLVFSDYMRPSIRLSALMGIRIIYIMTHDSIGLGEDGPTHQPVEHLASLRAIPNLLVFRPADNIETLECWEIVLKSMNAPSVLALSRQNLPFIRTENSNDNLSAKGAYIISDCDDVQVTIIATGSEVQIALEVQKLLEGKVRVRVISMVCAELFDAQDCSYKDSLLKNNSVKVAIEAAIDMGWHKYIGSDGIFIGMNGFGASAKANDLYEYFKITASEAIKKILKKMGERN